MLLPADLLLSLTSAQQPGRPDSSGQSVLPVVDVAAVQSWLDAPDGQGADSQSDPRALINKLLSGMTEQQSDSFTADFVQNLQALVPPAQPLKLSVPADLLSGHMGTDSDGADTGLPLQWTVDELLKFSEQILPSPQSQPAFAADSGSALPPAEQNLPQVLISALAALQGKNLQGTGLQNARLPEANLQGQPGQISLVAAQPVPGAAWSVVPQPLRSESASIASLSAQTLSLQVSERPAETVPEVAGQAQSPDPVQPEASAALPTANSQVSAQVTAQLITDPEVAAVVPAARYPASDKSAAQPPLSQLTARLPDWQPMEAGRAAHSQPGLSETLTVSDSLMQADRRPLVAAIDAALHAGSSDLNRSVDRAASRQDSAAALLSTAAPTAGELAQELYGADQRRQLAAQAREATVASQQMSAPGRAASDNLQMGSFGQTQWGENVSRQLLMMTANGVNSAQIRLDPPELGTLTIKVKLIDQAATVNFVSQHAMVRDALELQIPRLQEQFRQEGLELVDVSVSDQSAQQGGGQGGDRREGHADHLSGVDDEEGLPGNTLVRQSSHLIDYYA